VLCATFCRAAESGANGFSSITVFAGTEMGFIYEVVVTTTTVSRTNDTFEVGRVTQSTALASSDHHTDIFREFDRKRAPNISTNLLSSTENETISTPEVKCRESSRSVVYQAVDRKAIRSIALYELGADPKTKTRKSGGRDSNCNSYSDVSEESVVIIFVTAPPTRLRKFSHLKCQSLRVR
jgi:hypothetical protein